MSLNLSKSKYCSLWQCPKIPWLHKYRPEEQVFDELLQQRMTVGSEVGDLAKGLFGDFVEVTVRDGDRLDLAKMIERTAEEMAKETPVICEASFSWRGLYCAVDLLRREGDCAPRLRCNVETVPRGAMCRQPRNYNCKQCRLQLETR